MRALNLAAAVGLSTWPTDMATGRVGEEGRLLRQSPHSSNSQLAWLRVPSDWQRRNATQRTWLISRHRDALNAMSEGPSERFFDKWFKINDAWLRAGHRFKIRTSSYCQIDRNLRSWVCLPFWGTSEISTDCTRFLRIYRMLIFKYLLLIWLWLLAVYE